MDLPGDALGVPELKGHFLRGLGVIILEVLVLILGIFMHYNAVDDSWDPGNILAHFL